MMHASDDEVKLDSQGGASPVTGTRGAYMSSGGQPPAPASAYGDDMMGSNAVTYPDEQINTITDQNIYDQNLASGKLEAGQVVPDANGHFPMNSLNHLSGSGSRASIPQSYMPAANATYYSQ